MPEVTIIEIPQEQQDWMLRELRRSRYGYLLTLHILLLLAGQPDWPSLWRHSRQMHMQPYKEGAALADLECQTTFAEERPLEIQGAQHLLRIRSRS